MLPSDLFVLKSTCHVAVGKKLVSCIPSVLTLVKFCISQLFIEPELRTNRPRKKFLHSEPPEERVYEPEGVGGMLKKGDEVRSALVLSEV